MSDPTTPTTAAHTSEPWVAEACERHHSHDSLTCFKLRDVSGKAIDGPTNLRRIVACVNALAGIADPAAFVKEHAARGAALAQLDLLLDFDSPVSDELPVKFADTTGINAAFAQAREALK